MFHTIQNGTATCWFKYCLPSDATITESGATAAQDLDPVFDDSAAAFAGSYRDNLRKLFLQRFGITAGRDDLEQHRDIPYVSAAILQYWGERFGDPQNDGNLEAKVAGFLDKLNRESGTNGGQLGRMAAALGYNYATGTPDSRDPISALRDFYIAALSIGNLSPADPAFRIRDDTTNNAGLNKTSDYPPLTVDVAATMPLIRNNETLEPTLGRVYVASFGSPTSGWVSVALNRSIAGPFGRAAGGQPFPGKIAVVPIAGGALVIDPANFIEDSRGSSTPIDVHVTEADKIAVVVVASTLPMKYDISVTLHTTGTIAILTPADGWPQEAVFTTDPIAIDVVPRLDGVLARGLRKNDVLFTIEGQSVTVAEMTEMSDRYHFVLRPPPLPAGEHDVTATFVGPGAVATAQGVFRTDPLTAAQAAAKVFVAPESLGTAGTPIDVHAVVSSSAVITGAALTATIMRPGGGTTTLQLADDGAHHDGRAGDGSFGGTTFRTTVAGTYSVSVIATGTSGGTGFSSTASQDVTVGTITDVDGDGVADAVEPWFGADPTIPGDGASDLDGDGTSLVDELAAGTDPLGWDSDLGGEADASETARGGNPFDPADDVAVPTPVLSVAVVDGRSVRLTTATVDGTGSVEVFRSTTGTRTSVGLFPGTGSTLIEGPLAAGAYGYFAVGHAAAAFGNVVVASAVTVADDVTAPMFALSANGGRSYTSSSVVPVAFAGLTETPIDMRVATSESGLLAASWVAFAQNTAVDTGPAQGLRKIFGQLRDAAGNTSSIMSTSVSLDTTAPESTATSAGPYSTVRRLTIPFTSSDSASGVSAVELWSRFRVAPNNAWGPWAAESSGTGSPAIRDVSSDGFYEVYTIAVDAAGNREAPPPNADFAITVDTVAPSSAVGALPSTYVGTSLTLPLTQSDTTSGITATEVWRRYRVDPTAAWSTWLLAGSTSTTSFVYAFPDGPGYYEFYSRARDAAGNYEAAPATADAATQLLPFVSWGSSSKVNSDTSPASQVYPDLAMGANLAQYLVWQDRRGGNATFHDIYFSRRDPGTGVWSANTKVNSDTGTADQWYPSVVVDSTGRAIVAWQDPRTDSSGDIFYAARSPTGTWSGNTKVNSGNKGIGQLGPDLAIAGTGTTIATWIDFRSAPQRAIYAATLAQGSSTWSVDARVSTNTSSQKLWAHCAADAAGAFYVVWGDDRSGNNDIYLSKRSAGGSTWSPEIKVSDDPGTAAQQFPAIAVDGSGKVYVAWVDARGGGNAVRVASSTNGGASFSASVALSTGAVGLQLPTLAAGGSNYVFAAWEQGGDIFGSVWNPSGGSWSPAAIETDNPASTQALPTAAMVGQEIGLAWNDGRTDPGLGDIYARRGTRN